MLPSAHVAVQKRHCYVKSMARGACASCIAAPSWVLLAGVLLCLQLQVQGQPSQTVSVYNSSGLASVLQNVSMASQGSPMHTVIHLQPSSTLVS